MKSFEPLALREIILGLPLIGIACTSFSLFSISKCGPEIAYRKIVEGLAEVRACVFGYAKRVQRFKRTGF
jgi:hypothetical protein